MGQRQYSDKLLEKGDELHTRRLWVVEGEEVAYIRETTGFPGLEMILRADGEIKKSGVVTSRETRHFVAGLGADQASSKQLMGTVRGRWGVENGLHFLKNRWWEKTASGVRVPGWRSGWPHSATER